MDRIILGPLMKSSTRLEFVSTFVCLVSLVLFGSTRQSAAQEAPSNIAPLPATSNVLHRIAFGSCAKHWQHQPIWEAVIARQPDLFLFLGDAIYADTDGVTAWSVTEKQLQGEWNRLADKPEFQRMRGKVPIMATWDNHDYGSHNGGAEFELKQQSKKIFLDFFGETPSSLRRQRTGLYDAKTFGPEGRRVQIILLDTRTFRGPFKVDSRSKKERARIGKVGKYVPQTDESVPILGDEQWSWLESQFRKPAQIRLVCSSTQIIPDKKGMDEWGYFPAERRRLFDLVQQTNAAGVILLSGNVHFAEISSVNANAHPLLEFTSSGLTHIKQAYADATNEYRVAGPFVDLNFGLVQFNWEEGSVNLITCDVNGTEVFRHDVPITSLLP